MTGTIAVISDIHGNLQALTAVLAQIDKLGCDSIYCLGDIVGYGARPAECIDLMHKHRVESLMGNHDALVCDVEKGIGFNTLALESGRYARNALNADQLRFLCSLPDKLQPEPEILMAHGSPGNRNQYLLSSFDCKLIIEDMSDSPFDICFVGHTHLPCLFSGDKLDFVKPGEPDLQLQKPAIVNPGSVGQPRDRNNQASFLIWQPEQNTIRFERTAYDCDAARQDILDAGLPARLGDRLLEGR